jgi:hypothetical protein
MQKKGIITRDARLSIRVPSALKEAIERHAAKARRTVADTVIPMLEEAMQRVARRGSDKRAVKSR